MRASDFDNVPVFPFQPGKGPAQPLCGGEYACFRRQYRCNMQSGGEGVVAGLGGVHMVVGVEGRSPLRRQMRNHLIDIHIGLGAGPGLPYRKRKFARPLPGADFAAHRRDDLRLLCRQLAIVRVYLGAGFF
ncbi:hypothetical protein SDC9_99796 [bioreactor metagenome]|uniref:Uncharacterized protein n=1 Tax=bioreactor metagenome TaxID=1076179 RepID=A0A645AIH9_9ZZZZ